MALSRTGWDGTKYIHVLRPAGDLKVVQNGSPAHDLCGSNPREEATENSKIWIGYSALFANEGGLFAKDHAIARSGTNVIEADPKLDANYRPAGDSPLAGKGDTAFGEIGLR